MTWVSYQKSCAKINVVPVRYYIVHLSGLMYYIVHLTGLMYYTVHLPGLMYYKLSEGKARWQTSSNRALNVQ